MTLIVDFSVAGKWFVTEPDADAAEALIADCQTLLAPDLVIRASRRRPSVKNVRVTHLGERDIGDTMGAAGRTAR